MDGRVGNTNRLEYFTEVEGDKAISGPLREPSDGDDDRQTLTVTGGVDQGLPTNGDGHCPIEIDCGLDPFVLVLNERVLLVTVGMVVSQDVESLGIPALTNQPTRGFGAEQEEGTLDSGGDALEGSWNPPRPRGVEIGATEGTPGGNDGTAVPEGVVEGAQGSAVGGIG